MPPRKPVPAPGDADPEDVDAYYKSKADSLESLLRDIESVETLQLFFVPYTQVRKVLRIFQELLAASEALDGSQRGDLLRRWLSYQKSMNVAQTVNAVTHVAQLARNPRTAFVLKNAKQDAQSTVIEYEVHQRLNNLRSFVPNFPLAFGMFHCNHDASQRRSARSRRGRAQGGTLCGRGGPLTTFIMMELVPDAVHARHIAVTARSVREVVDVVVQVLLALEVAQRAMKFTHYDLHPSNVLLSPLRAEKPLVFVYHVGGTAYPVSARHLAAIIDFGTAYVSGLPDEYKRMRKWQGFHVKSWGQISDRFHPAHDMMRFVDSMVYYMNEVNDVIHGTDRSGLATLNSVWQGVRSDFPPFSESTGEGLRKSGGLLAGSRVDVGSRFKSPRDLVDAFKAHGLYRAPPTDARHEVRHMGFVGS